MVSLTLRPPYLLNSTGSNPPVPSDRRLNSFFHFLCAVNLVFVELWSRKLLLWCFVLFCLRLVEVREVWQEIEEVNVRIYIWKVSQTKRIFRHVTLLQMFRPKPIENGATFSECFLRVTVACDFPFWTPSILFDCVLLGLAVFPSKSYIGPGGVRLVGGATA